MHSFTHILINSLKLNFHMLKMVNNQQQEVMCLDSNNILNLKHILLVRVLIHMIMLHKHLMNRYNILINYKLLHFKIMNINMTQMFIQFIGLLHMLHKIQYQQLYLSIYRNYLLMLHNYLQSTMQLNKYLQIHLLSIYIIIIQKLKMIQLHKYKQVMLYNYHMFKDYKFIILHSKYNNFTNYYNKLHLLFINMKLMVHMHYSTIYKNHYYQYNFNMNFVLQLNHMVTLYLMVYKLYH